MNYKPIVFVIFSVFISCNPNLVKKRNTKNKQWVAILDENTMKSWSSSGLDTDKLSNFWKVEDGILNCNTQGDKEHSGSWFVFEENLDNFELKFKFRYDANLPGNSGLQLRSKLDLPNNKMQGPQIDIHPPQPFRTGLIYDETDGVKHWIFPKTETWKLESYPTPKNWILHTDGTTWNEIYVQCNGTRIITKINNVLIADFDGKGVLDDTLHKKQDVGLKGKIAFQLHKKHDINIQFKDIYLKKTLK